MNSQLPHTLDIRRRRSEVKNRPFTPTALPGRDSEADPTIPEAGESGSDPNAQGGPNACGRGSRPSPAERSGQSGQAGKSGKSEQLERSGQLERSEQVERSGPVAKGGGRRHPEQGSASIMVLAIGSALVVLAGAVVTAADGVVAQHRVENAVDLGALAGATQTVEGRAAACATASRIVTANGARLIACQVDGLDITITAEIPGTARWTTRRSKARAGPIR